MKKAHSHIVILEQIEDKVLPFKYRPGIDLISKLVLKDERVMNIVSTSLMDGPQNAYAAAPSEIISPISGKLH